MCINVKRLSVSSVHIYVVLCITLCIGSMYNIYGRSRLWRAASSTYPSRDEYLKGMYNIGR